jgi:hypothetical protein
MLGMPKRHEVEILLKAGHSKAEVARLAGVSLRSVNRISEEAPSFMSMTPLSERSGGLADPARSRISGILL